MVRCSGVYGVVRLVRRRACIDMYPPGYLTNICNLRSSASVVYQDIFSVAFYHDRNSLMSIIILNLYYLTIPATSQRIGIESYPTTKRRPMHSHSLQCHENAIYADQIPYYPHNHSSQNDQLSIRLRLLVWQRRYLETTRIHLRATVELRE